MKLDLGSFAFGSDLQAGGGNPSWGTALGQGKGLKFTTPGWENILSGMLYKAIPTNKVYMPIGKGGHVYSGLEDDGIQLAALFDQVYINEVRVPAPFIMVIYRDSSVSWDGRRTLKYSDKIEYQLNDNTRIKNADFITAACEALQLNEKADWIISDIYIEDQETLHMFAGIVNPLQSTTYANTNERKAAWIESIKHTISESSVYKKYLAGEEFVTPKDETPEIFQQIFYGAPGTGKSHEVNELTKGCSVIRTTFHPDSDYSTFVGCYKPIMADVDTLVVPVVVKSGISLQPPGTYKEKRITYKFVKQAFLKAYLAAWKKYADNYINSSSSSSLTIQTSNGRYTITGADNQKVSYERTVTYRIPNGNLVTTWTEIWKNNTFVIPKGGSGRSLEQAISKWIYDNINPCTKEDLDKGLGEFIKQINETKEVEASKNPQTGQIYVFSPSSDDGVFIVKTISHSSKNIVRKAFENEEDYENADEKIQKLVDKLREFGDDFEMAWNRLAEAVEQNGTVDNTKDTVPEPDLQFLIIEEINRGNCAQIFGDIFQLLDRQDNGFSTYPIEADTDIQKAIADAFKSEPEYQLSCDINVEDAVKDYKSNYGKTLSEDIQEGRVMLLPPNLYIWATMNTSDQSLFPIDSAFKRRWEWKYIKIAWPYKKNEDGTFKTDGNGDRIHFNYSIEGGHDWWAFLQQINAIIDKMTNSADKLLGYFFAKAKDDVISYDTFVSKVCFYLWNDIFKTYALDEQQGDLFSYTDNENKKKQLTFPAFYDGDGNVDNKVAEAFIGNVMRWNTDTKNDNI